MSTVVKDLGAVSAYAYAVEKGYTGTEAEFAELMADYAEVGQRAEDAADSALESKTAAQTAATTATTKASEAASSATTATTAAEAAQADADAAALDASQAMSAASTATTKATEATTAAATAVSAKDDAVSANTAAQSAKTAAQTAQTGAETAAASVQSSAEQIAQNTSDISELKEDFTQMESDGVVPSAEQILTDKGVTDSVPYHYRKTGGNGADRLYDQIVGGTVNWNQLCNGSSVTVTSGHKYVSKVSDTWTVGASTGSAITGLTSGSDMVIDLTAMFGSTIADYIYSLEQATAGAGVAFFKALFPNDYYPYNAGTLKSVEGVSDHKMVGFNAFDGEWQTGVLLQDGSVDTSSTTRKTTKNYIKLVPNETYCARIPSGGRGRGAFYDANKNLISYYADFPATGNNAVFPNNGTFVSKDGASYFIFVTPTTACWLKYCPPGLDLTKTCINLSDPTKNGTYEPYEEHSYPLDSDVTLRGIPKLDSNNKLYFDGDVYEYTGKVTRNTILRAYQSGDESLANAITDGTNTIVYSANASTEQAMPYQHLQQCDPNGTEEYVSTGIVPVGHNSFYPENLRAKVEQLPWDFASLIAPTESAFTATRNYTTGSLFIVDNVLYKATSNIANGESITPNTNCTATTLAEIISALA